MQHLITPAAPSEAAIEDCQATTTAAQRCNGARDQAQGFRQQKGAEPVISLLLQPFHPSRGERIVQAGDGEHADN